MSRRPWKTTVRASVNASPSTGNATAAEADSSSSARRRSSSLSPSNRSCASTSSTSLADERYPTQRSGRTPPMKLVYKPIGIVLGIVAGLLGRRVFDAVWGTIDEEAPPEATTRDSPWPKVLGAAALQGAI